MPNLSMIEVRRDFNIRTAEIKNYLNFASEIDAGTISLQYNAESSLNPILAQAWSKTVRASCFLLIYNLVESTMKNAIAAIFDDLQSHSVPFDACREGIKKVVLNNFKALSPERALSELLQIALDVVIKTFNKDKIFSGNIDSRKISEIAATYGFATPIGQGHHLLTIKNHRNDLAHGDKSFDEIGRDYAIGDIVNMFTHTELYLQSALDNIELYIDNQVYLMQPVIVVIEQQPILQVQL
jgi:hypothetical protein